MPQSLRRTWIALAIAALAVLVVAVFVGRDFARDVLPTCPTSLEAVRSIASWPSVTSVPLETTEPMPSTSRWLQLRFDEKTDTRAYAPVTHYSNVRIVWNDVGLDGRPCTCGSIPITLSGETPADLRLYRVVGTEQYVVRGGHNASDLRTDFRGAFVLKHALGRHHLQTDRIVSAQQLPALVAWLALGALGVALLRARRAMAYALRMHTWSEARLTPEGLLEGDSGETLGTLAPQSWATRLPDGPVLVAPSALSRVGLYRDMPVVQRRDVAEGTHARWASGTMLRLRDARVLAVISTACALLGFAARLLA